MQKLFSRLGEQFNLSGKEILVLNTLAHQRYTAHQLSRQTRIPSGRIYEYLNRLISLHLIHRTRKKPYKYYIDNIQQNVTDFLQSEFNRMVDRQNAILSLLEQRTNDLTEISVLQSSGDFAYATMQLLHESKYLRSVSRRGIIPFGLYPERFDQFKKVRSIIMQRGSTIAHTNSETIGMLYNAHQEFYQSNKKMEYIVEEQAIRDNFKLIQKIGGRALVRQLMADIAHRLKHFDIAIHVTQDAIPMQTLVSDKKVVHVLIHANQIHGVTIRSTASVELYNEYFDELVQQTKPMEMFLASMK